MLLLALSIVGGCTTEKVETSDGRPMPPEPHAGPVAPSGAQANRLALFVGQKPEDANRNGYPDLLSVTVMLWSAPHPTPIRQEGRFVFTLWSPGTAQTNARAGSDEARRGNPGSNSLGEWTFEGQAVTSAQAQAMAGPCYQFRLNLMDIGGEITALDRADLTCRFEPADGSPHVSSDGVRTIQVGRR